MKYLIKILPFIIALSFTLTLLYKVYTNNDDQTSFDEVSKNSVGNDVPELELQILSFTQKELSKEVITQKDYKDKITVINLFASWCIACLAEHKLFTKLRSDIGDKIQLIGINWRDRKDDAVFWLEKNGNPYNKIGFDNLGKYGISLGIRGIPETFIVDKQGIIIDHYRGNIDEAYVKKVKQMILKESEKFN